VSRSDPTENIFPSLPFLAYPPGDYSEPLGKNPSISTASPCG